jgi:polyisoprenoid-binding protein YceI
MKKLIAFLAIFLLPTFCFAAKAWKIDSDKSALTFTAIQNNAPVTASFNVFSGKIHFNPQQLNRSQVDVVVDIHSLSSSYKDLTDTILSESWLNAKQFPKATFKTTSISLIKDKQYKAEGNLQIRDKTLPVTVYFTLSAYSDNTAIFVGHVSLKRLLFGVGQGEWGKTDQVKDDVDVHFNVTAAKE